MYWLIIIFSEIKSWQIEVAVSKGCKRDLSRSRRDQDVWNFVPDETYPVSPETRPRQNQVLRPRRQDRDFIPDWQWS